MNKVESFGASYPYSVPDYAVPPSHPNFFHSTWKSYHGYPPIPPPGAFYYPPSNGAHPHRHSAEGFRPHVDSSPTRPRPPPVVTIINPRFEATELIYDVNDHDVLCGRGAPTSWHPGNQFFRLLVDKYQSQYIAAKRMDKPEIAMHVVALVRERGGRFLKRTKVVSTSSSPRLSPSRGHFAWQDIGEQRSYEKACQALREGAPDIRKQLAAKEIASFHQQNRATLHQEHHLHGPESLETNHRLNPPSPFSAETRNDREESSEDDGARSLQE